MWPPSVDIVFLSFLGVVALCSVVVKFSRCNLEGITHYTWTFTDTFALLYYYCTIHLMARSHKGVVVAGWSLGTKYHYTMVHTIYHNYH